MTAIGETLRRERTRRSLNLDQISRQTKISVRLLEAIENEQFDKLPGGVFTKSFVKQYARALGLDEDEIASELERVLQPPEAPPPGAQAAPAEPAIHVPRVTEWEGVAARSREKSSLPALAMVVAVMLVCSGFYAWWQRARRPAPARESVSAAAQTVPATRAETPPAEPETASRGVAAAPMTGAAAVTPAVGGSPTSAGLRPAAGTPASPAATAPVAAPPAQPAGPLGNPAGPVQVTLKATEPVWVKAWVDGKVLLVTTLQANETRTLGASEDVRLRLGNAGGLEVELNGKPVGPLGPKGQIRVVELSPRGVEVIPTTPPAPPGQPDTL
ncbi:MAG TPA: RodZ domain-containing protein [Bryobacteraceae bacterium]|nr:RodZ domain-containing protein [Bryobacteraceae bacterium]